jgi:hypothetical protein
MSGISVRKQGRPAGYVRGKVLREGELFRGKGEMLAKEDIARAVQASGAERFAE